MDSTLSESISGQAVKTAATQADLANLAGQTQIATQQQERDVRLQQLSVEAEARRMQITADSQKAQAEADAVRLKAQAEADAVKIQADALISQAKAEAERATLLSATPLGEKSALLEIYGDVVKTSNEGVQKIVYIDPTTTQAGNPFSLLTLQTLQKDIAQLGQSSQ